ncbi:MAG: porin family protein [Cyclobacteriaceae bacterium]
MKTIYITIVAIAFTFTHAISQSISIKSIEVGPKMGLNISHWGGEDFNTKSKAGLHIGGFAMFQFSERYSLQPELLFSAQGSEAESGRVEYPVNYLSIPVLAKIDVYEGLYFNVGPQIAFLLSAKENDNSGTEITSDEYKGADLSLAVGAGYELPMGLHFQLRYNAGLSNFNSGVFADEKSSNHVIQISAAYILWKNSLDQ